MTAAAWAPATGSPSPSSSSAMRVMSWNIHHGVGNDAKLDLERIARVIRAQSPDWVALQEVDCRCRRSGGVDQTAELARLTGMHGSFGKAFEYDGGEYGLAILSRNPIRSVTVHRLPGEGEPRIALEAIVEHDGQAIRFVTTHLDHQQESRRLDQARALQERLSTGADAVILCGDFNDVPGSPTLEAFAKGWSHTAKKVPEPTFPAEAPRSAIDHILLRGLKPSMEVKVIEETLASDHRPLVLEWK